MLQVPWRRRVVLILGLTGGFFIGQVGIPLLSQLPPLSDFGALVVLVACEILVRLRSLGANMANPFLLRQALDNIRVGFLFSVVLEAFKLGS